MRKYSVNALHVRSTMALSLCLVTLCVMLTAGASSKAGQTRENHRSETKEIENMEAQWRAAIMKGDTSTMERLLSEDFLAISARGTLSDKSQYLHRMATRATQFSAFDLMDLKVRVQAGSAVAVSQARIAGMLEGHQIEGIFRYTKVYGRASNGDWHITNFEATRVSGANETTEGMVPAQRPAHHGWR